MCQLGKLLKVGDILLDDVEQLAGADHLLHRADVGPDLAVHFVERDFLADVLVDGFVQRSEALTVGVQAAADVDGLAVVPMETMSSWLAEEGMESTEAGCA